MGQNIKEKIEKEIEVRGYIRIDQFMSICLNDAEDGYYINKHPIGKGGDFITAPEISQLFGEIIALFIADSIKRNFEINKQIQLVEIGAGKGTLTDDVLRVLSKFPDIFNRLELVIVEISDSLRQSQQEKLGKYQINKSWVKNFAEVPNISSIIYCNEFFDALPIRQFIIENNNLRERVIKLLDGSLILDTIEIPEILDKDLNDNYSNKSKLKTGQYLEISKDTEKYSADIFGFLMRNKGLFLTFDYGYLNSNHNDTLQSIYRHKFNSILENLGEADLTAYVNFDKIIKIASKIGIRKIFFQEQGAFLESMGIKILAEKLKNESKIKSRDIDASVNRLISPDEMGNIFKCLIIENY